MSNNNILEEFELYKGKNFSSVCKDIVENQYSKKTQLDVLVSELRQLVKTANDAVTVVPLIRDYIEVGVKNDEQLVKLIGVVQRILSKSTESSDDGTSTGLTPEEISQLRGEVSDIDKSVKSPINEDIKKSKSEK